MRRGRPGRDQARPVEQGGGIPSSGERVRRRYVPAVLDALFPGLGHLAAGRRRRAALFGLPVLALLLLGAVVLATTSMPRLAATLFDPAVLWGILALQVGFLVWRLLAVGASLFFSAVLVAFWTALTLGGETLGAQRWFVWSVFILVDIYSTVMVGIFWIYTNDVVSRTEADRLYAPIGLGGIFGGIAGGVIVDVLVRTLGHVDVLLLCAALGVVERIPVVLGRLALLLLLLGPLLAVVLGLLVLLLVLALLLLHPPLLLLALLALAAALLLLLSLALLLGGLVLVLLALLLLLVGAGGLALRLRLLLLHLPPSARFRTPSICIDMHSGSIRILCLRSRTSRGFCRPSSLATTFAFEKPFVSPSTLPD